VDCIVTSPPYYGLRDYGTGEWVGGDADCDHQAHARRAERPRNGLTGGTATVDEATFYRDVCGRCGARRVDQQIGLEPTPAEFIAVLVDVFRECRRVLADHGNLWVNMGDSYGTRYSSVRPAGGAGFREDGRERRKQDLGAKNLLGMPWRVAFALQDDGWILRRDVVWFKSNPMPESVTDRCTSAHEYVFHLVKRPRYWYDNDAVREEATWDRWSSKQSSLKYGHDNKMQAARLGRQWTEAELDRYRSQGRNLRSVWEIATQPTPEAHFATYPEELVRRCVLAGCPEWVCETCGKPRERIVERGELVGKDQGGNYAARDIDPMVRRNGGTPGMAYENLTLGWSDCGHNTYRRGVVLDPFIGSGTTAKVARDHGRHAVGIELKRAYLQIASGRLAQQSLLT
jgi:DNA modification methylase